MAFHCPPTVDSSANVARTASEYRALRSSVPPPQCSELRISAMRDCFADHASPEGRPAWIYLQLNPGPGVQRVGVVTTKQRLGGERWWYRCPDCGRRCAVLYRPLARELFACRKCSDMRYESQRLSPRRRAEKRARAIRAKLRVNPADGSVVKPRRMRETTFERLLAQLAEFERAATAPPPIPQPR